MDVKDTPKRGRPINPHGHRVACSTYISQEAWDVLDDYKVMVGARSRSEALEIALRSHTVLSELFQSKQAN